MFSSEQILSFIAILLPKSVGTYLFIRYLGFNHTSFVFAQEANMHENKYNSYKVPSGLLILFLEKALTLVHMETHLDDVSNSQFIKNDSITVPFGAIIFIILLILS
jgi:hypothetical protein